MRVIWLLVRDYVEWIYAVCFGAMAVIAALDGHWVSFSVDVGVGVIMFSLYRWWFDKDRMFGPVRRPDGGTVMPQSLPDDAVRVILSKGYESISDGLDMEAHQRLNPNCELCKIEKENNG